jgi:predicted metal-binding membrane protein
VETKAAASRSPDRIQISLVGALVAISAVAWLITDGRMVGMDAGPGTDPGALGFYLSTWVVMMAAMMFPSVAATISVYSMVGRGRRSASIDGQIASQLHDSR